MNFVRNCPKCGCELTYKSRGGFWAAQKKNSLCKSCAAHNPETLEKNRKANSGINNPMYGKTVHNVWVEKYGQEAANELLVGFKKACSKKKAPYNRDQNGSKNPMYGKTIYEVWIEKYGKEEADKKQEEWKQKVANHGEQNGMYGKPSPLGSGNGWGGYYKDHYFRSLLELAYLKHLLDSGIAFETGEQKKHVILYEVNGKTHNYFPDYFLIDDMKYIEIKPENLVSTYQNKLKFDAAKQKLGEKFAILTEKEIVKLQPQEIYGMYLTGEIKFNDKYEQRFLNYLKEREMI